MSDEPLMLRDTEKRYPSDPAVEPDERFVRARAEDRSWWIRTSYVIEKYRVIVYLVGVVLISLGFGFRTPKTQFEELGQQNERIRLSLQAQIDTLKQQRQIDLEDRAIQLQMMRFSVRYICSSLTAGDKYRLGGEDLCADAAHAAGH